MLSVILVRKMSTVGAGFGVAELMLRTCFRLVKPVHQTHKGCSRSVIVQNKQQSPPYCRHQLRLHGSLSVKCHAIDSKQEKALHCCSRTMATAAASKSNKLASELSPYLRQHKDNPVAWYPWGKEAIEVARRENKMIFLSIGYSTCHWLVG